MSHSYVYIVRCADGSLYTGTAADPERAVADLNRGGGSAYVKARMPVFLAYTEEYMNDVDAARRAAGIKRLKREDKERLLAGIPSGFAGELGYAV